MSEHLTVSEGGGRGAPGRHTTGNALATRLEMLLRADAALLERELTTGNARWLGMDLPRRLARRFPDLAVTTVENRARELAAAG